MREKVAALEHEQWAHLMKYLGIEHPLIDVPYEELTEKSKDSDRKWADKVLCLIAEAVQEMPFAENPFECCCNNAQKLGEVASDNQRLMEIAQEDSFHHCWESACELLRHTIAKALRPQE